MHEYNHIFGPTQLKSPISSFYTHSFYPYIITAMMKKNYMNQRPSAAVLLMILVVALTITGGADASGLSCGRITGLLIPCVGYLSRGGAVPRSCCAGVRAVFAASRTTADRRGACKCLKATSHRIRLRAAYARTIPRRCRLSVPSYLISPTTDCNRIR